MWPVHSHQPQEGISMVFNRWCPGRYEHPLWFVFAAMSMFETDIGVDWVGTNCNIAVGPY